MPVQVEDCTKLKIHTLDNCPTCHLFRVDPELLKSSAAEPVVKLAGTNLLIGQDMMSTRFSLRLEVELQQTYFPPFAPVAPIMVASTSTACLPLSVPFFAPAPLCAWEPGIALPPIVLRPRTIPLCCVFRVFDSFREPPHAWYSLRKIGIDDGMPTPTKVAVISANVHNEAVRSMSVTLDPASATMRITPHIAAL